MLCVRPPVLVSYGAGTNSTAMLVEMARRGEAVDGITFADTGGEKPATYEYLAMFSEWLQARGMPKIEILTKGGRVETLEEDCLRRASLPSVAFGFKTCSLKYKVEPQEKFAQRLSNCVDENDQGGRATDIVLTSNTAFQRTPVGRRLIPRSTTTNNGEK